MLGVVKPGADLSAIIGNQRIDIAAIRQWESKRAAIVLAKFSHRLGRRALTELLPGIDVESLRTAGLADQRSALVDIKTGLGHAGIYALLRPELAASERLARLAVAAGRGRTTHSVTRITAVGCSAAEFGSWFTDLTESNAEADMVAACPDHYLLRGLPDGRQEVVETTGGSPAATRFLVDYSDTGSVSVPIDPDYPVQIAGRALLDDGTVIGGVRHQFRDFDGALQALLTVEFPAVFPRRMVEAHRWHLACEFGNWILRASAGR